MIKSSAAVRPRFITLIILTVLMTVIAAGAGIAPAYANQPTLLIEINGAPVIFRDAFPYIDDNNRTMVPVRFVSEALGADVAWDDATQAVTIRRGFDVIRLRMNRREIWVNGDTQKMDTQMVLNRENNRNYVPLRFVSQNLGATISVTQLHGGMGISITQVEVTTPTGVEGVHIGSSANDVRAALGAPDLTAPTPYTFHWWVYGRALRAPYRLVGVKDGRVVSFYTNSEDWVYRGITIGTGREEARSILGYSQENEFRLGPTRYQFSQRFAADSSYHDFFVLDDKSLLTLYYDIHENNTVTAARFTKLSLVPMMGFMNIKWTFIEEFAPDHNPPTLTKAEQDAVDRGNEQILFDLVNKIRTRMGRPTLRWHEALRHVAYLHSVDMAESGFFDHDSPNTGDPGDRIRAGGISFRGFRENIAMGQPDAIDAHEGLMNSLGHREAILDRQMTHLGVGAFHRHYTEKFIQ